ncbi:hypothetical protein H4S07_001628 [Coemansia furcata]|uniref:Uncharacterized protein n=1 Tax=Coemansia furcata TaxID=417177 RepID=A0ACC1LN88_9FUNG|nr:hypothetical protein H4S07_001628 [Coemansia furcata]
MAEPNLRIEAPLAVLLLVFVPVLAVGAAESNLLIEAPPAQRLLEYAPNLAVNAAEPNLLIEAPPAQRLLEYVPDSADDAAVPEIEMGEPNMLIAGPRAMPLLEYIPEPRQIEGEPEAMQVEPHSLVEPIAPDQTSKRRVNERTQSAEELDDAYNVTPRESPAQRSRADAIQQDTSSSMPPGEFVAAGTSRGRVAWDPLALQTPNADGDEGMPGRQI